MNEPSSTPPLFAFDNSYARLPSGFSAAILPTPVKAPRLIRTNDRLAQSLGVDPSALRSEHATQVLAGNILPAGAEPIAMAYAGHQFGSFVPQLGDGRAILLGEVIDRDGVRRDVQLKGAGPTPFSRSGDGRAALGPVLREYLLSESFAALGIPTTRSLAAVATGETVWREAPLPGAILTRVAASHVRVGTFQFFAARGDVASVRQLADYVIARHYPHAAAAAVPYRALLDAVIVRQADLIAQWMSVGFIHGVMNTDNTSIAGETIDFGPCAFMDQYDPSTVYSSIDRRGRYAYGNQPTIAQWNLARLAETLLPLLADTEDAALEAANAAIGRFPACFEHAYVQRFGAKLGLTAVQPEDRVLVEELLDSMAAGRADFTLTFRGLCGITDAADDVAAVHALFADPGILDPWIRRWRERLQREPMPAGGRGKAMRASNPAFIARNHLVEAVIVAGVGEGDFTAFDRLLAVLEHPFEDQPGASRYGLPPRPEQVVQQTFCGT